MKSKLIIDAVELNDFNEVIACKGRIISKNKIVELDELCYQQMLIDLGIDKVI